MNRPFLLLTTACILFGLALTTVSSPFHLTIPFFGSIGPEPKVTRHLFVGDVMLGRFVETLIEREAPEYPFVGLAPLRERYDTIIGNFEAPIPPIHTPTPPEGMSFSVPVSAIPYLAEYFDVVSLANNHTYDTGLEGLTHTRQVLNKQGVRTVGDPVLVSDDTVTYVNHFDETIAVIALHGLLPLDTSALETLLMDVATTSRMQIAYIHWGVEYEITHSPEQRALAEWLIDRGVDAVIGHHPHVVQDIELYRGAPIFYSLGNFIFDQYFSREVEVGLGVELAIAPDSVSYRLIPFTSVDTKSSPRLMAYDEREAFLKELASRSDPALADALTSGGVITVGNPLASL